jgi:hypothetical protein
MKMFIASFIEDEMIGNLLMCEINELWKLLKNL